MKLKIRSLHMENFKGIKSLDVNFSNKTSIKGQNAAGKTTIFDGSYISLRIRAERHER